MKSKIAENLKNFFGKDKIKIATIDGTKYQRPRILKSERNRYFERNWVFELIGII